MSLFAVGSLIGVGKSLIYLLIWTAVFMYILYFLEIDDKKNKNDFYVYMLLMIGLGGGHIGYWLFAHYLGGILSTKAPVFTYFLMLLWFVIPIAGFNYITWDKNENFWKKTKGYLGFRS